MVSKLYTISRRRLAVAALLIGSLSVSTKAQELMLVSRALTSDAEAPLAGVYVHENLAYVGGMSTGYTSANNIGIRIVDLSDPTNPALVGRIPLRASGYFEDHSHGDAVAAHIASNAFEGTVAIVLDGVPDSFQPESYPEPYGLWDVSNPADPIFLSILNFGMSPHGAEGGDLGDKPRDARAVDGHHFFALYEKGPRPARDFRLGIADISDPRNPVIVGDWQDDPRAALMGLALNESGTRAYITAVWSVDGRWGRNATHRYLYVLDVEDRTNPREIGRYVWEQRNVVSSMNVARPTQDDSLVILLDGTWEQGQEGEVHLFNVSDPSNIRRAGRFDTQDNLGMAVDVAVRGDRVYTTWLNGAVVVLDISNPSMPVEVGRVATSSDVSDVALLGESHVVASTVWWSGLYIMEDQAVAATSDDRPSLPGSYELRQNYPNPFNPSTEIRFELPQPSTVHLAVYDLTGREVATLVDGVLPAGKHEVAWQAEDRPSGVYLYRLTAGSFSDTRAMALIR